MAVTKFNVVLDIPLTSAQKSAIDKEIKSVIAKHVARLDLSAILGEKQIPKIPKREWYGIWIKRFDSLAKLKNSLTFKPLRK
ncbi:MAG: hypothetical protein KF725_15295 [Cyclobacteriaceae bacterium]|nr:hypothetical protein [Cyclobacteriaceae bacterium]UYN87709.1 MAG: hypothetical protein KIT51_05475 [Cyclobacteriaceae bacterium]